ncbi:MAG TPA: methyltransferase [Devosiaceae bacterium]
MSVDQPTELVKQQTPTRDAFLGGRLNVSQPGNGFRAGLDSVILGTSVDPAGTSLLDLGAGVGTASLVALATDEGRSAVLIDDDREALALAAHNISLNGFAGRATVLELDVTAKGAVREATGLRREAYASVIANPPFFDQGTRAAAPSRAAARHMDEASLDRWAKTAAAHVAPGGEVIFIHLAATLPALLAVLGSRLGALTVLPLAPRPGEAASRVLVRGIKASRAPMRLLATRVLHEAEGRAFAPEFEAIFRGTGRLVW